MSTAIYICSNEKMAPLGHIFMDSWRKHNTESVDVFWFVDTEELAEQIRAIHADVTVSVCGVTSLPNTSIYDDSYFYGMTMKIFALESFIGQYDRVVYFDVDTIINGDPSPILHCDLGGKSVGAVKDIAFDRWPQEKPVPIWFMPEFERRGALCGDPKSYVNSGMMVFDMTKITALPSLDEKAQEGSFVLLDQDYINHVFDGDIATLDESWNYMSDHIYAASMTLQRRMQTSLEMGRAVVQHFHANAKPWGDQVSLSSGAAMQIHTSSFYTHCDAVRASLGDNWVSVAAESNRSVFALNEKRVSALNNQ